MQKYTGCINQHGICFLDWSSVVLCWLVCSFCCILSLVLFSINFSFKCITLCIIGYSFTFLFYSNSTHSLVGNSFIYLKWFFLDFLLPFFYLLELYETHFNIWNCLGCLKQISRFISCLDFTLIGLPLPDDIWKFKNEQKGALRLLSQRSKEWQWAIGIGMLW